MTLKKFVMIIMTDGPLVFTQNNRTGGWGREIIFLYRAKASNDIIARNSRGWGNEVISLG